MRKDSTNTKTNPRFRPDDRLSNLVKEGGRQEPYEKNGQPTRTANKPAHAPHVQR
jgi:hypothetical protein